MNSNGAYVDHLVVLAANIADGVKWCEQTLGVTPGPGGEHPLMGTHNRLLPMASAVYPYAYLEIIAVNPDAMSGRHDGKQRWFDIDDAMLSSKVASGGPRLIHYVAQVPDVVSSAKQLLDLGIDRGPALSASRMTPSGLLEWQICVRDDGQRLFDGCLPTLIQWGKNRPFGESSTGPLSLQRLQVRHPNADLLRQAHGRIGLANVEVSLGEAALTALIQTPSGLVEISS